MPNQTLQRTLVPRAAELVVRRPKQMQMNMKKKLWGLLAFSPLVLFLAVVPWMLRWSAGLPASSGIPSVTSAEIRFLVIGNLYVLFVFVCFLIHLNGLKAVENDKKWLWRGLMFFGHVFAFPVYWYFHIWKGNES